MTRAGDQNDSVRQLPMDSTVHVTKGTRNNEAKTVSLGSCPELQTKYKHHGCYHEAEVLCLKDTDC